MPTLAGFGGRWTMIDEKLYLNIVDGRNIAVADMENDELVFTDKVDEYYDKLRNQRLKQKHSRFKFK